MEDLGLPKNKIRAALPYKGNAREIAKLILGEGIYGRSLTDVTDLIAKAVKDMIVEGIAANNQEITRQLTEELESLRRPQ